MKIEEMRELDRSGGIDAVISGLLSEPKPDTAELYAGIDADINAVLDAIGEE
jgi:hypothetical protein